MCDHQLWEPPSYTIEEDLEGNLVEVLLEGYFVSTLRDTGLHTYECTLCGESFFYSDAAKEGWI